MSDEFEIFEADIEPSYIQFPPGQWVEITMIRKTGDHEEFKWRNPKTGKKEPAPVWLVMCHDDDTEYRLSLTSSRLVNCFEKVKQKIGTFDGVPIGIRAEGDGVERSYKVRLAKSVAQQSRMEA